MVLEVELSETRVLLTRYSSTPATFPLRAAAVLIRRCQSVRNAVLTCCPERERIILLEWLHSAYISTVLNMKVGMKGCSYDKGCRLVNEQTYRQEQTTQRIPSSRFPPP